VKVLSGCALIYDAHELESEKNGQSRFLSRATLLMESMSWRQIDLLVSVSRPILDWYSQRFGTKPSILVMNSPAATPDCGFEKPTGRHFHLTFGIPEDKLVFLYLGILAPGRGIPGLLEAFSNPAVRSHLVFVGYRDMMGVKKASERVSNIHVHPPVPHGQVVQLSRSADCGLCLIEDISLSDRYCLPNKLFEYAFAGLPVLASRLPEIDRVVREFGLGMCCNNDAESIGAAVREIEQGAALPSQADLSELTWETQGERLRGAYVDLLSKRGRLQELNRMRGR
jgi:glycosyltransferase involved in cell wall biosynthesis